MSKKQFDEAWLKEYQERTGCRVRHMGADGAVPGPREQLPMPQHPNPKPEGRSKYGNDPVVLEGQRFDSRHEARTYERLRIEGLSGAHIGLARQVTFFLPGGVRYVADFVTLHADGSYRVIDAKSAATRKNAVYRLKKRQMKACLGLDIEEV